MNTYQFNIPAQLNGNQLKNELDCELVYVIEDKLVICGELTREEAEAGIAAHKPITPPDTAAAKAALFAKLGITAEEAQLLLGGN